MVSLLQRLQQQVQQRLQGFRRCESGAVISAELVILGTVVVAGLVTGWAALQQSVVSELSDLSEAVSALDQSYSWSGHQHVGPEDCCLASSAGSRYVDTQILCDDARPVPMSECCLSPIIVHDTTRPGEWHCDRCGHQHLPQQQPGKQGPPRDGSRQPPGPPPVPPVPADAARPRIQSQGDGDAAAPRPEPERGPERRPGPPGRRPAPRGESGDNPGPFTPRDNPPSRRQETSEGEGGGGAAEESDEIIKSDLYMLAQLQVDEPYSQIPAPPGPIYPQPDPRFESPRPPDGHVPGHGDGHPHPTYGHSDLPPVYPPPYGGRPRYECRGHREPISTPWRHGAQGVSRSGLHSGGCGGSGSCGECAGVGLIRPGVEYPSGVRGVRVTEIPLNVPAPLPRIYHPAPHMAGHDPGFPLPSHGWPAASGANRHEPRFPDYVWQPVWQVVW